MIRSAAHKIRDVIKRPRDESTPMSVAPEATVTIKREDDTGAAQTDAAFPSAGSAAPSEAALVQNTIHLKAARGRRSSSSSSSPTPVDIETELNWKLLTLPRALKGLCVYIHRLDRQYCALMQDLLRLTEVYMILAAIQAQGHVTIPTSNLSQSQSNVTILSSPTAGTILDFGAVANTRNAAAHLQTGVAAPNVLPAHVQAMLPSNVNEAMERVEGRIREVEHSMLDVALEKVTEAKVMKDLVWSFAE